MKRQALLSWKTGLTLTVIIFMTAVSAMAGDLIPPGAPAPTMKTLDEVEPRTPISSLPYVISDEGSYYVTANLTAPIDSDGITITKGNVTLDLHGFTLLGPGRDQGTTGTAIRVVEQELRNVVIKNGGVRQWRQRGIYTPVNTSDYVFENLCSYNNGDDGLCADGSRSKVIDCTVSNNGGEGIRVVESCIVSGCTVEGNADCGIRTGAGCQIVNNVVRNNTDGGISAGANSNIIGNVASRNTGGSLAIPLRAIFTSNACTIMNNTVCSNYTGTEGISIYGILAGSFSTVKNNTCCGNNASGSGRAVGIHCTGGLVEGNTCCNNGNNLAEAAIGIQAVANATVRGNFCSSNQGVLHSTGIRLGGSASLASGNNCTANIGGNSTGILVESNDNVVEGNTLSGHTNHEIAISGTGNYWASNRYNGTVNIGAGNTAGTGDLANVSY